MSDRRTLTPRLMLIVSITVLASCTKPYWQPDVHFAPNQPTKIVGVKQLLKTSKTGEVDVITIHGMCTHGYSWAFDSINELAAQLGDDTKVPLKPITVEKSDAVVYKRTVESDGKKVNISAIVWSPILRPLKEQLCYDQKVKSDLCAQGGDGDGPATNKVPSAEYVEQRATLNRLGKDKLMDDCLVDAVAYQGKAHDEISKQMQEAILSAANPIDMTLSSDQLRIEAVRRKDYPLVILTSSLGSKVGFDALDALRKNRGQDEAATKATVTRTVSIFMAANQLPILQLADQSLSTAMARRSFNSLSNMKIEDSLRNLLEEYGGNMENFRLKSGLLKEGVSNKPTVIVLSDPNDILSYSWLNSKNRPDYVTVDVIVSNDKTWFSLLENPGVAHTGYFEQPYISDILMNGYSKKK